MLQGQRYVLTNPYDNVSAHIMGTRLNISADDYIAGKPSIVLEIANYQGALIYEAGTSASITGGAFRLSAQKRNFSPTGCLTCA
jgi:hypothetical protein